MPQVSRPSRRRPTQARAKLTVDAILEAAAEVFEAHGFDGGTTERIVERAGVSVGSMYQYFPNKGALVQALAERYHAEMRGLQEAWIARLDAEAPDIEAGLRAYVDWLVAGHASRPRLRCMMFEEHPPEPAVRAEMHALHARSIGALERWLTGRVPEPAAAAQVLQRTVTSGVHHFVLHPTPELPAEAGARHVLTMARAYLQALGAAEPG